MTPSNIKGRSRIISAVALIRINKEAKHLTIIQTVLFLFRLLFFINLFVAHKSIYQYISLYMLLYS